MTIQFIDLAAQQERLRTEIETGIAKVLAHGRYVFGPEIVELEDKLAGFSQADHAIACANGTDALVLSMMAIGVGPGDAVFCPSFTFCATAESVALLGAKPVFVDIDRETYNLDPESLKQAIADIKRGGELTPKAIIAVDLFGQAANYPAIFEISKHENIKLIADSAQGFGSTINGNHPSHWADFVTVSFFPAKPLGCYGDGGAILTNDATAAHLLKSLRMHGAG
ncbi:MAG: DegT/DnrJ/EryC1/StrS family aminotransferase, partial [Maricaulaceae bacterium]